MYFSTGNKNGIEVVALPFCRILGNYRLCITLSCIPKHVITRQCCIAIAYQEWKLCLIEIFRVLMQILQVS